jgi:hypothetical protein
MRLIIDLHALQLRGHDHSLIAPSACYLYGLLTWLEAKIRLRPWRPTFPAGGSVLASPSQARRVRRSGPRPGERAGGPTGRHRRDAARAVDHHQLIAACASPSATCAAGACHLPGETVSLNLFDIAERRFTKHKPGIRRSQETERAFLIMGRACWSRPFPELACGVGSRRLRSIPRCARRVRS